MSRSSHLLVLSLICCLAMIAGCGKKQASPSLGDAIDAYSKAVDKTITDPDTAKKLKDQAITLDYTLTSLQEDNWNQLIQSYYLHADYDTTPEDFAGYLDEVEELRTGLQRELVELAGQSRTLLSEEEWTALHKATNEELD